MLYIKILFQNIVPNVLQVKWVTDAAPKKCFYIKKTV